ncbi:MAG: peptidoglycan-associated lipoprotein Pal [Deltaproteobacteria bacterium]|nr:peptidoglycan-associated lipoprotein Pal [Deltaproteobacteria bacterium]MBT8357143.1 peptidoglycan-associated lipoprotein Pal [Deltaproteobacteria bacterium]MBT8374129.1 peptidoglycan-associated lipoprotein Pal [Deltaproteobacteria bacterium]NNK86145.1 peptidoglycan-associated lipoprotein Pal [Desulfobacterales bacterium]NNL41387.1 peptidoglycan-associated lipoprotein Pal [Desulfobacterales bacterium]
MRKNLWIGLVMLFLIPGLLFTVSCAQQEVTDTAEETATEPEKAPEEAEMASKEVQQPTADMSEEERAILAARNMFLTEDIYFEFDKSSLDSMAQDVLSRKSDWMRDNPDVVISIEGHCDERGTNEYNLALGEKRAESAKSFLVDLGIDAYRISTVSYGEERPEDDGHNEEAWAKNRRATFIIP